MHHDLKRRRPSSLIHIVSLPRFLNIRLDSITVLDEARHPHMVLKAYLFCPILQFISLLDGGQKLLYPGFRREVCTAACRSRRHPAAGGRDATRYASCFPASTLFITHW